MTLTTWIAIAAALMLAMRADAADLGRFNIIGAPIGPVLLAYQGGGTNVPFEHAVRAILPDDWQLAFEAKERHTPTSWTAQKRDWPAVLAALAIKHRVAMTLDWKIKVLRVNNVTPSSPAGTVMKSWESQQGETLRAMTERWAKSAGWKMVWNVDYDYPMTIPLTVKGNLIDAVASTFRAFDASERPFYVDAYSKQRVFVVSERNERG